MQNYNKRGKLVPHRQKHLDREKTRKQMETVFSFHLFVEDVEDSST